MALVHVLEYVDGRFRCVLHTPTPAGNNSAGIAWSTVFLATGRSGRTAMVEGTGPGQIDPAEKAEIQAGTLLEFEIPIEAASTMTGAQLQTLLQAQAAPLIAAQLAAWQSALKFYGATRP
jgi:hypothetical protein